MHPCTASLRWRLAAAGVGLVTLAAALTTPLALAADEKKAPPPGKRPGAPTKFQPQKPVAPPAPRSALLTQEAWRGAPLSPVSPSEIDELVGRELRASNLEPAPLTTDEQFLRRVTLDLTGKLPTAAEVAAFTADKDPAKRARLIDQLLDSDAYAQHWAHYWRDVITARLADRRGLALATAFEKWLTGQFKSNQGWDKTVRAMLTVEGECRFDDTGEKGAVFFLASHRGPDAANELAAEASRLFLGIRIQCAQCHDHPSDQWKRVQFHELAAYFARVRERPVRDGKMPVGIQLVSAPFGEHEMTDKDDPKKTYLTHPRFLDGKEAGKGRPDLARRQALADAVTDKGNYWFAGAYVNRVWGALMGQAFYEPVDDMGPKKEAVFASLLARLAASFRGTDYDVKAFFRAVLNSQTYQRQLRPGEPADGHLHFAAAYPTRLRADVLWDALAAALGPLGPPLPPPRPLAAALGMRPGLEGLVKQEFGFDPSLKPDEVEGSIPQALLLMNNPLLHQRIQARGNTPLAKILADNQRDEDAVAALYLRTLARKPTDRELTKCRDYIRKVGSRPEAFEDILWSLINSTEFQTKR